MFAFVGKVPRQSAQGQAEPSRQQQNSSDDGEQESEAEKRFAKIIH
jgi:hypothetical protein